MKKALAYVATAVLLGAVIMALPLKLVTTPLFEGGKPYTQADSSFEKTPPYRNDTQGLGALGLSGPSLSIAVSGLILFAGLIVALGAFTYSRKRIQ